MSHTCQFNRQLALAITTVLVMGSSHATSLLDVYDQAAQSDPTIRAAEATRLASREARPQALAAFLPDISANAGWAGTTSGSDGNLSSTSRGGSWGITATESINLPTILRSLERTDYTLAQADLTYHSAELNLITRVATRYFNVLSAKDSLKAAESSLEALNQQLERAEKRFEVGLAANTDVQEARASRDSANSLVILAKRTLATSQELLREITGTSLDDLAAPSDDMPLITPDPQSADEWVQKSMSGNIDLASSRLALETATHDLGTQKLTRFPTLTLSANYSNSNAYSDLKAFGSNNTTNNWTGTWFSAGVSVPLFTGGETNSKIRQNVYLQRAARERVEQVSRETERGARDAYLGLQSAIAQVQANKQALESSRLALQATEAGFDVGTRTTIDVLNSRNNLLTAEQNYFSSRYSYITSLITLKTVSGSLTREDLQLINSWLIQ
ncbi:MAG: TolC family outer membrane protein [Steroidobacteraceae bacterium]